MTSVRGRSSTAGLVDAALPAHVPWMVYRKPENPGVTRLMQSAADLDTVLKKGKRERKTLTRGLSARSTSCMRNTTGPCVNWRNDRTRRAVLARPHDNRRNPRSRNQIDRYGGTHGVLDDNVSIGALARVRNAFYYGGIASIPDLAATIAFGFATT